MEIRRGRVGAIGLQPTPVLQIFFDDHSYVILDRHVQFNDQLFECDVGVVGPIDGASFDWAAGSAGGFAAVYVLNNFLGVIRVGADRTLG